MNSYDPQHLCLLRPQNLVPKLTKLENTTVDYMCFQVVPLRSIILLCVNYTIRLKWVYLDHFIPKSVNLGERVHTALASTYSCYNAGQWICKSCFVNHVIEAEKL